MRRRITPEQYRRAKTAEMHSLDRRIARHKAEYEAEQRRIDQRFNAWVREQRARYTPEELARYDEEDRRRSAEERAAAERREQQRRDAQRSDTRGT